MNLDTVLKRQIRSLPAPLQATFRRTEDELRVQDPRLGYAPLLSNCVAEFRHEVIVLKIAAETLEL